MILCRKIVLKPIHNDDSKSKSGNATIIEYKKQMYEEDKFGYFNFQKRLGEGKHSMHNVIEKQQIKGVTSVIFRLKHLSIILY